MTRVQLLLAGLAALLLVVLFWLLVWSPGQEELAELRDETQRLEDEQAQTANRIAALEAVREEAPAQEARLAAAQAVIPRDTALPAFLRQLQLAADESGLALLSVSPARPATVDDEAAEGLHRINVTAQLEGTYFQLVDLLRRIEDPSITPRAILWNSVSVSGDPADHPTLQISLQGDLYAILPTESAVAPETEPEVDEEDDDADVEIEVDE